ncbi:type II secretion system protein [bacterium]|nr:type II secretion system protein [bacterium]
MPNNFKKSTLTPTLSHWRGSKCAFTLAEVLITLVIIGVIAAITVPTLMNSTNNQETVSKLKKAYSTMAQATNLIIAEEGPPVNNGVGWVTNMDDVYNLYIKHLHNAKECSNKSGCLADKYLWMNGQYTDNYNAANAAARNFVLADGTYVAIIKAEPTCTGGYSGEGTNTHRICAEFWIDINGAKKPNAIGRDLFAFILEPNGLYPAGCDNDTCNKNSTGFGCTCKVLREGAINY